VGVEELDLLERVRTRQVAGYGWMQREESVESRRAGLLRSDHQKFRKGVARFVPGPDLLVSAVVAGILQQPGHTVIETPNNNSPPTPGRSHPGTA
jgi:hypothetical protein